MQSRGLVDGTGDDLEEGAALNLSELELLGGGLAGTIGTLYAAC
jgi:phytoene/squalene synthetase